MGAVRHAIDTILCAAGRTPLVRVEQMERPGGPRLFAKCEHLGPAGSIFDRAAVAEIQSARRAGHLREGRGIVAAGGGDASISLAMASSAVGSPLTLLVPRSLNVERKRALTDYGARLVAVDDETGLDGATDRALNLARERDELFVDLFDGAEIVAAYERIGAEIVQALGQTPVLIVCGLDLGAIPTGIARGARAPIVAVEPATACIGSGRSFGAHLLGGLAPAAVPVALDRTLVKDFEPVDDREAWTMSERLSRDAGLLVGIASGAVMVATLRRAALIGSGDVVAVLPDSGERRFMLSSFFA